MGQALGRRCFAWIALVWSVTSPACVTVMSHSYSNAVPTRNPVVSRSGWDYGVLRLSQPTMENVVLNLAREIGSRCAGAPLTNVQTTLALRDYVVVQVYRVRLTAECAGAKEMPGLE